MSTTPNRKTGRPRSETANPESAKQAIEAYAKTGSLRRAAAVAGMSKDSVRRIIARQPQAWAEARQEMARKYAALAEEALELGREKLAGQSGHQLVIISAVATDKSLALTGNNPPAVAVQINVSEQLARACSVLDDLKAELARRQALKQAEQPPIEPPQPPA